MDDNELDKLFDDSSVSRGRSDDFDIPEFLK